jgi:FkbM family methyltransferase
VRDSWEIYQEPRDTPLGFKLSSNNRSMTIGRFEPEETQIVKNIIPSIDVIVNVGANVGYYCCIALQQDKDVIAFEPITLNIRYLLQNIKANNWESQIEIYPIALSNKIGIIEMYGGGTGASLLKGWAGTPDDYSTLVPCSTLDNVLGTRLQGKRCFIIIDIEGAEQLMLEGASFIIDMEPKPLWMIEITISDHQPKGITINPNLLSTFCLFWDRGYDAWTADKECRCINYDEIEEIIKSGIDTCNTHNFLFIEKGKKVQLFNT